MRIRPSVSTALIGTLRNGARHAADWHVPLALIAAAACLVAAVTLPILAVREFFFYGQELSILDGVNALLEDGDWLLAAILVLFSIAIPLVKIGILLAMWWRLRRGRSPRGWLLMSLEWSSRWAMLDVFVVALAVVVVKAQALADAHVAGAVYPFVAAVGLIAYSARAVSTVRDAQQAT
jgi:paraquat-inducible protein A